MLIVEDNQLLDKIADDTLEPIEVGQLIMEYWHDLDRAERTPRDFFYLHIGFLFGSMMKLRRQNLAKLEEMVKMLEYQNAKLELLSGKLEM